MHRFVWGWNPPAKGDRQMARILVMTDPLDRRRSAMPTGETPVLMDEHVSSVHLVDGHAAEQLIERLAWAVSDAEEVEAHGLTA